MAIFKADKAVLLAKAESNYGVDPTPAAANLIVAHDVKVDPAGLEMKRDAVLSVEGKLPSEMYEGPAKVSFKTHLFLAASPGAGYVLGPLFAAASMVETKSSGEGWSRYTLAVASDGATASVAFYFYHGGRLYKVLGCCGSVKMALKTGELIELEWEFTGKWLVAGISDAAFPSLVGKPTIGAPVRFAGATFTLDAIAMAIANATVDFGQKVTGRKDPAATDGVARYWVESVAPKVSLDPQADALATHNPFSKASTKDLGTLALDIIASAVHHKLEITNLQPSWPKPGERDGLQTYAIDAEPRASDEATAYSADIEFSAV